MQVSRSLMLVVFQSQLIGVDKNSRHNRKNRLNRYSIIITMDIWQFLFGWTDDFLDNLPKRFGCAIFSLIVVEIMAVLWFLVALFSASGRDKVWEWTNNVIEWLNDKLD